MARNKSPMEIEWEERRKEAKDKADSEMEKDRRKVQKLIQPSDVCFYCGIHYGVVQKFVNIEYTDKYTLKCTDSSRPRERYNHGGTPNISRQRGQNFEVERVLPGEKYTKENCEWACYPCNNAKSNFAFTEEEFKPIAMAIHQAIVKKLMLLGLI